MGKWRKKKDNDWNTPSFVWDDILHLIPKEKTIWLPFYFKGYAGEYLKSKGLDVIHQDEDFWENNHGDCVIDNPPFTQEGMVKPKLKIMERLISLNKPFMLLLPSTCIQTKYFKQLTEKHTGFQLVIPRQKYDFEKDGGIRVKCLFYTLWICWNMNFEKDYIMV
jgi:hypothetical protein